VYNFSHVTVVLTLQKLLTDSAVRLYKASFFFNSGECPHNLPAAEGTETTDSSLCIDSQQKNITEADVSHVYADTHRDLSSSVVRSEEHTSELQ
jgi:hypothetical protein